MQDIADGFAELAGKAAWAARMAEIERRIATGGRAGKALAQYFGLERGIDRIRRGKQATGASPIMRLAADALALNDQLDSSGRDRLQATLRRGMRDDSTLIPLFHLLRCAAVHRAEGFQISYPGLTDGAAFDLLLSRRGADLELVTDVMSAEEGRSVHRGSWFRLADRIDPDLQTWLAAHPGRYVLKVNLPGGLPTDEAAVAGLYDRIRRLLSESRRADTDEAIVLRLDPLLLAGAQMAGTALGPALRQEFGPDANLAIVSDASGLFVIAARSGRDDEVALAMRRRMASIAPLRFSGARPGLLAMFVEDTDRLEWRGLQERLELEGEARQFLTQPEAKSIAAVTVSSRFELFGAPESDGELRFRNPSLRGARLAV